MPSCLSAPDAIPTSLPPELSSIIYYLKLNSGVVHKEACLKGICHSFLYSNCSAFQGFSSFMGVISHMLVLATLFQLYIILNTWILTIEAILVLAACS